MIINNKKISTSLPTFIMMCGLPGSGKSTYAEKLRINYGYKVHASDKLRENILGDVNKQDKNDIVFRTLHNNVKADLLSGKNVIYDATNINRKRRINFLREIKNIPCIKYCILLYTPYEICLENNKNRKRSIPENVIERMLKSFHVPSCRDGFDVIFIDTAGYHTDLSIIKGIQEASNIYHDNPNHLYSIGDHLKITAKYIMEHDDDKVLRYAALLHDIGKPFCKTFVDKNGENLKYAHYYGHENVSAYFSIGYLKNIFSNTNDILKVAYIINYHMRLLQIKETDNKNTIKKMKDKLKLQVGDEIMQYLIKLHEADIFAAKG